MSQLLTKKQLKIKNKTGEKDRAAWRYIWLAPDIRRRILITLGLLAVYRFCAHIPIPGADRAVLAEVMNNSGAAASSIGLLDLLSGGTLAQFSILAMGVYPYITAQIILQLLVPLIPALKQQMESDPREGRKWMEKWTYILTVPIASLQAIGEINIFSSFAGAPIIPNFGFSGDNLLPSVATVLGMTAGTMFTVWLGELISEYGARRQGLSIIIFSGIVSRIPMNILRILSDEQYRWILLAITLIVTALTVFVIVYVQQGRRNIPVIYPGRRTGNQMSMPVKGMLPLSVNMAGMIPLIFAQTMLSFPAVFSSLFLQSSVGWLANAAAVIQTNFNVGSTPYQILYFVMVIAFTFFYTDVTFTQQRYGENLKRAGAQIPGVRPGATTENYLRRVQRRITLVGALFLGGVAILPWILSLLIPIGSNTGVLLVSSSGLLIAVGVVRDVYYNLDAELKMRGTTDAQLIH